MYTPKKQQQMMLCVARGGARYMFHGTTAAAAYPAVRRIVGHLGREVLPETEPLGVNSDVLQESGGEEEEEDSRWCRGSSMSARSFT